MILNRKPLLIIIRVHTRECLTRQDGFRGKTHLCSIYPQWSQEAASSHSSKMPISHTIWLSVLINRAHSGFKKPISNKKKSSAATSHMAEPYAQLKKPVTKGQSVWCHLCEMARTGTCTATDVAQWAAGAGGEAGREPAHERTWEGRLHNCVMTLRPDVGTSGGWILCTWIRAQQSCYVFKNDFVGNSVEWRFEFYGEL